MRSEHWQQYCLVVDGVAALLQYGGWRQPFQCPPVPPLESDLLSPGVVAQEYDDWRTAIVNCRRCNLSKTHQPVLGEVTNSTARLLVVVEPRKITTTGCAEPLPPKSHNYLLSWLKAINVAASYQLTNIVKCATPGGRRPFAGEILACQHHIRQQVHFNSFRAILVLGTVAAQALLGTKLSLENLRCRDAAFCGLPVVVSYDPSVVLEQQETLRRPVWEDLRRLADYLGL